MSFLYLLKSNFTLIRPGILAQVVVYSGNAIGLTYFSKHSFCLQQYKKFSERHGAYGPDEPGDELNVLLNDIVSKDLKDVVSENTSIGLYLTPGLKTTHVGTVGTISGGLVGVPVFYEFKNEEDVKDNILVNYYAESDQEKEQSDCFLLSNNAKKYAIAREILLINSMQVYINAALPFVISLISVLLLKEAYQAYRILKKPLYMRVLIYTAIIVVGLNFWRTVYKKVLRFYETEVESEISRLGVDYIEGGIEYCTKEIKRNSLPIKVKDEKARTLKAIEDFFDKLIPSGVPLSVRLSYLKQLREQPNIETLQQLT